jgi:hypothetical protein
VGFILGHRAMFNSLGDYKYFARTQRDSSVSELNADAPAEDKKEIVSVVVLVPIEFALHFDDH